MGTIVDHRDLDVWRLAMRLAEDVFQLSDRFPPAEAYGLRLQLRRASASVARTDKPPVMTCVTASK